MRRALGQSPSPGPSLGLGLAIILSLGLAGCFAPPFPDAPVAGAGHGHAGGSSSSSSSSGDAHDAHVAAAAAQGIAIEHACVVVSGPPGDAPQTLGGIVWHDGSLDDSKAALVLVPGGGSLAHYWDGDTPALGVANASTLPRQLARAGYAVFSFDRLGMGESPYEGDGHRVTPGLYATHAGEAVAAVRAGAYATGAQCDGEGTPVAPVVLGGHSYGAVIAQVHAGDPQDDIDGLLLLNYVPGGGNPGFVAMVAQCVARQEVADPTADAVYPFCPGEDGWSQELCYTTTWPPGSSEEVMRAYCDNAELHKEPTGALGDFGSMVGATLLPRPVGAIPVLSITADHDCTLNRGDACDDTTGVDRGLDVYAQTCGCDLTTHRNANMGHNHMTHLHQWIVGAQVTAWMEESFG